MPAPLGAEVLTDSGQLDDENLVAKDIVIEGWADAKPAKRIRSHARASQLRQLVDNSPDAWARLVAIAAVLAEHRRANVHKREADWNIALANFEPGCWQWKADVGRASQMKACFKWLW